MAGPRICIAVRFAMAEAKILLSKVLRRAFVQKVTDINDIKPVVGVVTRPNEEVLARIVPRK